MCSEQPHTISFVLINELNQLKKLAEKIGNISDTFDLEKMELHDINLVLEEWITNLIRYGYQQDQKSEINIRIEITEDLIDITVMDEGSYFNIKDFKLPDVNLPLEKREPGGLGLHFIYKLMDKVIYEKQNNKNILHLKRVRMT
jgi:anti-sigma regulatory factor (Ser/Thr protein kinase)